jgi:hypothetical protein
VLHFAERLVGNQVGNQDDIYIGAPGAPWSQCCVFGEILVGNSLFLKTKNFSFMQPVLRFGKILVSNSLFLRAGNFSFMQPVLRFGEILVSNSLSLRGCWHLNGALILQKRELAFLCGANFQKRQLGD